MAGGESSGWTGPDRAVLEGARVLVLYTRWHGELVGRLLEGALGVLDEWPLSVETWVVPGAWELPQAANQLIHRFSALSEPLAVVALGAVVRGGTPHFEYVAGGCCDGLMQLSLRHRVPVINGVLTVHDMAQAWARADGAEGNKGAEAARAALDMLALFADRRPGGR